jgi:hypothetical protein
MPALAQGSSYWVKTYTPDNLVQALEGAMARMVRLTTVERIAGFAVSVKDSALS